jgi:hypothetical protein
MRSRRGKLALAGLFAAAVLVIGAQPAAAIHQGATLDCASAGTFTLKAADTGAGLFPPSFFQVELLTRNGVVVGTMVPFQVYVNGSLQTIPTGAADAVGSQHGLSTCSFTGSDGSQVVLIGILNV